MIDIKLLKNWDKILTCIVSVIALFFSYESWHNQNEFENEYRENSDKVILNSIKLAKYDLNLLLYKAEISKDTFISYQQLNYQIKSLEENLKVVKEVKVTNLPRSKSMNYQVYVQDLSNIIYKEKDELRSLKVVALNDKSATDVKKHTGDDPVELDTTNIKTFRRSIRQEKDVLNTDENGILVHRDLYDLVYKKASDEMRERLGE